MAGSSVSRAASALACTALAAGLLGGCAGDRTLTLERPPARSPVGNQFAGLALDNGQLGAIRGGFNLGAGAELRFAFQEATYVNQALVQTVVLPVVTLSGVAGAGMVSSLSANLGVIPAAPASPGFPAALGGTGTTSVFSTLGAGGLTSLIASTANGQLVQQVSRVEISLSGFKGLQQQGMQPSVLNLLRNIQALPR